VYGFLDWFQVSSPYPFGDNSMAMLRSQCSHVWPEPWACQQALRERRRWWTYQFHRPSLEVIQFFADRQSVVSLNILEPALDWVFDSAEARDQARAFHDAHSYKRFLRSDPTYFNDDPTSTRYTNPPGAATNLRTYSDRPCKLTGEPYCVHHEWRVEGTPAMHRYSLTVDFDQPLFWKSRYRLFMPDLSELGRRIGNITRREQQLPLRRQRTPWLKPDGLDRERLIGGMALHACGDSVQRLINNYRKFVPVTRCLHELDVNHLLPTQGEHFLYDSRCPP
jgi:hypothetical protein